MKHRYVIPRKKLIENATQPFGQDLYPDTVRVLPGSFGICSQTE